jgi:hypothetical protein
MPISTRIDLRPGITEPVVLAISRRQVQSHDMQSVVSKLKVLMAAREYCWRYRNQMTLIVEGYDSDPRELVDIPEVRAFLRDFAKAWPYWTFFFNLVDESITLLQACVCGTEFPGKGQVVFDVDLLGEFMMDGFEGMNELFEKFGFPDKARMQMTDNLAEYIQRAAAN